jgi:hypothetical protein
MDFLYDNQKIAVTERTAMNLFGTTNVLGDSLKWSGRSYVITAVLRDVDSHSNLDFGFWHTMANYPAESIDWGYNQVHTLVRLREGTDVAAFTEKVQQYKNSTKEYDWQPLKGSGFIPLGEYHYSEINEKLPIRFHYLVLFSCTGALVIVCALLNYLMLFVMRMRIRIREVELRRVCGSSPGGLVKLFGVEYILVLLVSGLVGMEIVELLLPAFRRLSGVEGTIYGETALYFVGVLLLALLCLLPFVMRHRRSATKAHRSLGNRISIWLQLVICMLFAFGVSVLMLQLHHLSKGDLGWERHNIAILKLYGSTNEEFEAMSHQIKELPMVKETLAGVESIFLPGGTMSVMYADWEGKPADRTEPITLTGIIGGATLANFYGLKLMEGELLRDDDKNNIMLTQTAVRALGIDQPVGKTLQKQTIVGVLKDFYTSAPTIPVVPVMFTTRENTHKGRVIAIKYREGSWDELKQRIKELSTSVLSSNYYELTNVEEEYEKFLTSERLLLRLLGLASLTCVLIAGFGIFSLVSLNCRQRRKEIAIRKVNGARIANILALFSREYLLLLVSAAVVAFPVGYVLMKHWLQSYSSQIALSWWLYVVIFAGTAAVVALCIGWRVWQTARSNPADEVKNP